MSYFSFNNIAVSFFYHAYSFSYSVSSTLISIPLFVEFVVIPLFGWITDRYGIKCRLLISVNMMMILSHYTLGFLHVNIIFTVFVLFILGIAWGIMYSMIWASIAMIINKQASATAIGIMTASRFLSIGISYILVGILTKKHDHSDKYDNVQYYQISLAILSAIFAFILLYLDRKNGYTLYYAPHTNDEIELEEQTLIARRSHLSIRHT
eukprot:156443_1